jgi:hypothetical protein
MKTQALLAAIALVSASAMTGCVTPASSPTAPLSTARVALSLLPPDCAAAVQSEYNSSTSFER